MKISSRNGGNGGYAKRKPVKDSTPKPKSQNVRRTVSLKKGKK